MSPNGYHAGPYSGGKGPANAYRGVRGDPAIRGRRIAANAPARRTPSARPGRAAAPGRPVLAVAR
ncbi:hypothetical protein Mro03_08730 [Microbispora rosea subsp. rosea]|nr:hypothetical protein Mro03_08730 [Microbispora rosea subsp. rosea]